MKTLKVVEFLRQDSNNLEVLKKPPYNLEVKIGVEGTWSESLVLLKYNQISSDFGQEMVKECRGLILDLDQNWKPVCWPFSKFMNFNQTGHDVISWDSAKILEKCDGSLLKPFFYKDQWRLATNGTIDAYSCTIPYDQNDGVKTFGDMFDLAISKYYPYLEGFNFYNLLDPDYTYMFEIVGPHNKVVISYPEVDLYWIGRRNNISGNEAHVNSSLFKFPVPKTYKFSSEEETVEFAKTLDFQHEGFVVVDNNFSRVKIKTQEYLRLHSLRSENGSWTSSKVYDILVENESEEVIAYFPEFKPRFDRVEARINQIRKDIQEDQLRFSQAFDRLPTRKDQALWIKEFTDYPDFFFGSLDGKYSDIEDYMRKARNVNYKRLKIEVPKVVEE